MKAPRITKEDLMKKMEAGEDLLIIDVRSDVDYNGSGFRLPGSVRVQLDEVEGFAATIGRVRQAVAYCT